MNDTGIYFKKLNQRSIFLYDFCTSIIQKFSEEENKKFIYLPEFKVFKIAEDYFTQEPVIKKIHEEFQIDLAGIFILEKHTGCDFHIDEPEVRKVTINMLISSGNSHSVFKTKKDSSYTYEFKELVFEEKSFYLYNVSREHGVINFDQTRYMFSIKFKNNNLTYDHLFEWCKKNNLLENEDKISNYTQ